VTRRPGRLNYSHAVGLGTAVLVVSLSLGAAASGEGVSTGTVLNSTRAGIAMQTSAHVTFTAHSGATGATEKIVADVGKTSGTEDISEGSAAATIRVTPSFAYVSGNERCRRRRPVAWASTFSNGRRRRPHRCRDSRTP